MEAAMATMVNSVLLMVIVFVATVHCDCTGVRDKDNELLTLLKPLQGKTYTISDSVEYNYQLAVCSDVGKRFTGVGVLQYPMAVTPTANNSKVVGRITNTSIKNGTDWVYLEYGGGDKYTSHCTSESRNAHIMIICNSDQQDEPSVTLVEENNEKSTECYYLFEMETSLVCRKSKSNSGGLGVGSIVVICLFVLVLAYIIIGVLFNRIVMGAKGLEQIPNFHFWQQFGELCADGCNLVCRCQPHQEPRSYKGMDDQLTTHDENLENDDTLLPM